MRWRARFGFEIGWREWVAALEATSPGPCSARPRGAPTARTWVLVCPGVSDGAALVRDCGANEWEVTADPRAVVLVRDAIERAGGVVRDPRDVARSTAGVIDCTDVFDDARGSVSLTRDPPGDARELRVLVAQASAWIVSGSESERVFDDRERDEDRGAVDVPKLLRDLDVITQTEERRSWVLDEVVGWLSGAARDGARVAFDRRA